jgi:hypothetical protein
MTEEDFVKAGKLLRIEPSRQAILAASANNEEPVTVSMVDFFGENRFSAKEVVRWSPYFFRPNRKGWIFHK